MNGIRLLMCCPGVTPIEIALDLCRCGPYIYNNIIVIIGMVGGYRVGVLFSSILKGLRTALCALIIHIE